MSTFLFYVEPFPIRNSLLHFSSILDNISGSLLNNKTKDDYLIYGNKETLKVFKEKNTEYEKHFLLPTQKESDFFKTFLGDWDTECMAKWQSLMNKSEISDQYVALIKNLYQRHPFDYIVCWGTNHAVKQAAKELCIGFIDMELGCSRKPFMDTLVADPWGVNGASVLSQAQISDFDGIPASESELDLLLCNGENSVSYEEKFSYVASQVLLNLPKDKKVAYIPLQLYDDANLLQYSPYHTVEEVLMDILPPLLKDDYVCIVKEHPRSVTRLGARYANLKARLYAMKNENVIWLTDQDKTIPNSFLFQKSDVVVTVNSSTGFEALYYDKPLVVLGEAVYKIRDVFPTLNEYLKNGVASDYLENIGKIRNFFLNYYLFSHEKANDSNFFFNHLKFVGDLSKKNLTTKEIINAYYERNKKI